MEHPEEPYDAIRWFMPAMKEWLTQIFQGVLAKIQSVDESTSD